MQLTQHATAAPFLAEVQAALEQDEAANNLMLGLAVRLHHHPERIKAAPYLATVRNGTEIAAAALMTPPNKLVVFAPGAAAANQAGLTAIADDLQAQQWPVPGVTGRSQTADAFLDIWQAKTGARSISTLRLRIYKLIEVTFPTPMPSGYFRVATLDDLETLSEYDQAFEAEALHHVLDLDQARANVQPMIERGDLFVWDHAGVVSRAYRGRPTRTGIAISLVYTPPEQRGHGYASTCVAALSQHCLDAGRQFCALFTDLANPTSNRIYQKIGYRPVCDFNDYAFA